MIRNIIHWLATGETGNSSKTMAFTALGETLARCDYPYDPADLRRCILLVRAAPEVKDFFPAIRALNPIWANIIDHWDELESLYASEVGPEPGFGSRAPKTYERMRALEAQARAAAPTPGDQT